MAVVKKIIIILPSEDDSVISVINYGRNVKNGFTDNAAIFPDINPTLPEITAALTELENSIPAPSEKNTISTNLLQKRKKDFINNILKKNASYVLMVANDDRYVAGLSGYKLNKEERTPIAQEPISAEFVGPGAEDGTAYIRITERGNNDFFIVSLKEGDNWKMLDAFKLKEFMLQGLPSGSSIIRIAGKKGDVLGTPIELVVKAV